MAGHPEDSFAPPNQLNEFSFSSHNPQTTQEEQGPSQLTQGPWFRELEAQALAEDFLYIDHELVPCAPLTELHGLSFLCANAKEEFAKKLRPDVLLPSDSLQLLLFQARSLLHAGKVKILFPSFFGPAVIDALIKDPIGVDLSRHSNFYFELGEELCKLLPEHEWPHPDLRSILRRARQQRHVKLATQSVPFDRKTIKRLTFQERDTVHAIQSNKPFMGPFA